MSYTSPLRMNTFFASLVFGIIIAFVFSGCLADLSKSENKTNDTKPENKDVFVPSVPEQKFEKNNTETQLNLTDLSNYCFAIGGKFTTIKYGSGNEEYKCVFPNNQECKLQDLIQKNCSYDIRKVTLKDKAYANCLNPDVGAVFFCENESFYRVVSRRPYDGSIIYFNNESRLVCPVIIPEKQSSECSKYLLKSINCEELCKIFYSSNKSITNMYEKYCVLTGGKYVLNESDLSRKNDLCVLSNNVSCNAYEYYLGNCPILSQKNNEPIKAFTITTGQNSRITERKIYIIPISQEMENVWREMFPNPGDRPKIPEVDFSKYNVLAIYDGQRNCAGYSLVLESYEETENEIKVKVKTMAPGKNCLCATVITYPYILLAVSKSDKNISITRNLETYNC